MRGLELRVAVLDGGRVASCRVLKRHAKTPPFHLLTFAHIYSQCFRFSYILDLAAPPLLLRLFQMFKDKYSNFLDQPYLSSHLALRSTVIFL